MEMNPKTAPLTFQLLVFGFVFYCFGSHSPLSSVSFPVASNQGQLVAVKFTRAASKASFLVISFSK